MASIQFSSIGTNSCSVRLTGLDTSWSGGTRYVYYYFDTGGYPNEEDYSNYTSGSNISNGASSGGGGTVYGLSAGTRYYCRCYVYYDKTITTETGSYTETTRLTTISGTFYSRPYDWNWTTSISTSSIIPMDKYGFHPVTATEWNNFTDRINDFRLYAGYSTYSFSTVSQYQQFTPAIYNQAVRAIKGISGYGYYLSEINDDTVLCANIFTSLEDELNKVTV
ncbi:MAG: hypothetical protein IKI94_09790 [Ruminococcus sp.]|nr:hypothetical protein [Ruminococcus sp.]